MNLISIADAAKLLGRHEKTVRRWIKKQQEANPQAREKIVQEVIASGFSYRVDRDYLLTNFPAQEDSPPGRDSVHPLDRPLASTLDSLRTLPTLWQRPRMKR